MRILRVELVRLDPQLGVVRQVQRLDRDLDGPGARGAQGQLVDEAGVRARRPPLRAAARARLALREAVVTQVVIAVGACTAGLRCATGFPNAAARRRHYGLLLHAHRSAAALAVPGEAACMAVHRTVQLIRTIDDVQR